MTGAHRWIALAAVAVVLVAAACSQAGSGGDADEPDWHGDPDPNVGTAGHDSHDHDHDHDHGSADAATQYDADVADATQIITVEAVDGSPAGGVQRVEVDLGSVVALMVTSDVAEEVHVHGYNILRAVSPGHPAHFGFTAEIPGVFEVEFEGSGRLLLLLEIS